MALTRLVRQIHWRPTVDPQPIETPTSRANREFQALATSTVRFGIWAACITVVLGGAGLWLSWGHGRTGTTVITLLFAALGILLAFAAPWSWLRVTAPTVLLGEARELLATEQRAHTQAEVAHKARFDEMDKSHREAFDLKWAETEDLRGQLGQAQLRVAELQDEVEKQKVGYEKNFQTYLRESARIRKQYSSNLLTPSPEVLAARRVRTELLDANRKATTYADAVSKLPNNQTVHYEKGFRFETSAWQAHAGGLAAYPDAYTAIEHAYQEVERANDLIGWRETGAKGSYGVNREEDDLPAVVEATAKALAALDQLLKDAESA